MSFYLAIFPFICGLPGDLSKYDALLMLMPLLTFSHMPYHPLYSVSRPILASFLCLGSSFFLLVAQTITFCFLNFNLALSCSAEADRIKKSNGRVFAHMTQPHIQRVWFPNEDVPGLAMSRAFGDFDMKHYGIIVTPDVSQHHLTPNDHFVVLASDGVSSLLCDDLLPHSCTLPLDEILT